jgi:hypothetical protein
MLEEEPAPIRPVERFARTSAGLVLSASMLGLRDVLEGPRDERPAIVEAHKGEPSVPNGISMRLDPDNVSDSIILVRPWLLGRAHRGTDRSAERSADRTDEG